MTITTTYRNANKIERHKLTDERTAAANKGLKEMAGEVVNQTFVHLINFCAGRQFIAPKSATSLSPETLPETLFCDRATIKLTDLKPPFRTTWTTTDTASKATAEK